MSLKSWVGIVWSERYLANHLTIDHTVQYSDFSERVSLVSLWIGSAFEGRKLMTTMGINDSEKSSWSTSDRSVLCSEALVFRDILKCSAWNSIFPDINYYLRPSKNTFTFSMSTAIAAVHDELRLWPNTVTGFPLRQYTLETCNTYCVTVGKSTHFEDHFERRIPLRFH